MKKVDSIDIAVGMFGLLGICLMLFCIFVAPHYEAQTFNKYKSDNQPMATYKDALCTEMVVVAGGGAYVD